MGNWFDDHGAMMLRTPIDNRTRKTCAYELLQTQEALPPYELDPYFDDPVIRKRIGDLIAKPTVLGRVRPKRGRRGVSPLSSNSA